MRNPSVCVIGAGCSGITAIKNLIQAGVSNVVCFEQNSRIGGNWIYSPKISHSSVCETTHIISSKELSSYIDWPMPDYYPDYPSHEQVLEFFESYARNFKLHPYIRFNTKVEKVTKTDDEKWQVKLSTGESQIFDYLFISNGHHSVPRYPDLPGNFSGEYLHSHAFKTNESFRDKRVLVLGAGNSGCDCAVETARVSSFTAISIRTPQYIVPKFFLGKPVDSFNQKFQWLPSFITNPLQKNSLKLQIGSFADYGLPEPDFPVVKAHPTVNSELLYMIRHGKVHPRKAIKYIDGKSITFADGLIEEFDCIIAATGYKIALPFFDKDFINYEDAERVPLYLRMFHPDHPTLVFIGLVQPQGAIWPLSDYQSKLASNYVMGRWNRPENIRELAEKDSDYIDKQFLKRKRHTIEVHYHTYLKSLKKEIPKNAPKWSEIK